MSEIVLDTNVYISAVFFGGNSREIINHAVSRKINLFISPDILNEILEVLQREKFGLSSNAARHVVSEIEVITETILPAKKHRAVTRDIKDNIIIDCAVEARADYIVTGDNDLLSLSEYNKIRIVNPSEFLKIINQ